MKDVYFQKAVIGDGEGYAVVHSAENGTRAAIVVLSAEGKVAAYTKAGDGDPVQLPASAPGIWAYSLLTGTPSTALLDVLDVAHVDRESGLEEFFAKCADWAGEAMPGLVADALKSMSSGPEKRLASYDFYALQNERGVSRRQAAAAYPVFADLLCSDFSLKMAVDQRKPLSEVLSNQLTKAADKPFTTPMVSRFMKAPAIPEGHGLLAAVKLATSIPPDWLPRTPEDWDCFHLVASALEEIAPPKSSLGALLAGNKGQWRTFLERCVLKAFPADDHPARNDPKPFLATAAVMVKDMLDACVDTVCLPLAAHAQSADLVYLNESIRAKAYDWAWDILGEGRNLADLMEVTKHFHQERPQFLETTAVAKAAKARREIAEGGWPGLTDPVQAPGGLWLVPLCTPQELKEEGRRMNHCVGGYDASAKALSCHIVSVRTINSDGSSVSHSTAEFHGITSGKPDAMRERQHRAHRNAMPQGRFLDAMKWYVSQITSGKVKTKWDVMCAFRESGELAMASDQVERRCGYDWREREELDLWVRPFAPYVTKPYRRQGLDSMMDSTQAAAVIDEFTPDKLSASSVPGL